MDGGVRARRDSGRGLEPPRASTGSTTSTWCSAGRSSTSRCCSTPACWGWRPRSRSRWPDRRPGPQPGDADRGRRHPGAPERGAAGPAGLGLPRHIAFSTDHIVELARDARDRGLAFLPVPDNYYDDLVARFDLDAETVGQLRDLGLLYDREGTRSSCTSTPPPSATCSSSRPATGWLRRLRRRQRAHPTGGAAFEGGPRAASSGQSDALPEC